MITRLNELFGMLRDAAVAHPASGLQAQIEFAAMAESFAADPEHPLASMKPRCESHTGSTSFCFTYAPSRRSP